MGNDIRYHSMVWYFRNKFGLRQEDLAKEVDVNRRTIVNAESDNCNMPHATALRLAAYFDRRWRSCLLMSEDKLIFTKRYGD